MAPNPEPLSFETLPTSNELNGSGQTRRYRHHHKLKVKQQSEVSRADHDVEGLHKQLLRSISLVLAAIGFEAAAPDALESFAGHAEEFMRHLLSYVRASMVSSRRTQPVPHDFEFALTSHRYTNQSLLPHLDPPVAHDQSSLPMFVEPLISDANEQLMEHFHATLHDHPQPMLPYAPRALPILPSRHTYRATTAFVPRERDPKKIRELATEQARLGEEALRRLVAGTGLSKRKQSEGKLTVRQRQRKLWQDTMEAMLGDMKGDTEMVDDATFKMDLAAVPVNADRANWRKPVTRNEREAI